MVSGRSWLKTGKYKCINFLALPYSNVGLSCVRTDRKKDHDIVLYQDAPFPCERLLELEIIDFTRWAVREGGPLHDR